MRVKCPFLTLFDQVSGLADIDCPYLEDDMCDDIEINSGNGDAWCAKQVRNLEQITKAAKALCEKFINKVESDRARGRETYAECKRLLEIIDEQKEGESEV